MPWTSAFKINKWMIHCKRHLLARQGEFIWRATLTVHYGLSLAVECTSVVHSFLRCIVGLNECTRECPLWFRTPLKMAVPSNSALFEGIGGDFGIKPMSVCCSATTLLQPQPFLRNYIVYIIISLHFICSVLFGDTLLHIWNNCFIKAISPMKPWFTVNL